MPTRLMSKLFACPPLGLDRPALEQYYHFWLNFLKGNLGDSIYHRQSLIGLVLDRLPNTILLAVAALLVSLIIAFPLGIFSALNQTKWIDYFSLSIFNSGNQHARILAGAAVDHLVCRSIALAVCCRNG